MADDVLYHPSAALRKRIDSLSSPSTSELIGLLIEHLDAGSPRNWLAQAVKEGRFSARAHGHDILKLLTRASRWSFYTGQVEDESGKAGLAEETAPAASVPSALSEDAGRNIEELAFAQSEADSQLVEQFRNIAEAERYPNFPPSWGLDTATWTQTFGDHDPVPVINFYLASFFDEDISATGYTAICLSEPDFVIWHAVIAALAGIPWRIRIDEPELTAEQKARALQAALGLPEEIGPGLSLADSDLSEIIGKAPGWMASRLADWWTLDDIAWQRTNVDGVDDVLPDQVEVIYRIMIRHLVDWKQMDEEDLRDQFSVVADDLVNLPDYLPTCAHSYSRLVDAFWDAVDDIGSNHWYRPSLTKAVYRARSRVFRDRFPFPSDSILTLAELAHEEGFWLAHFCAARDRPRQIFSYLSFPTEAIDDDPWVARVQLVERARNRLAVYESALDEMTGEGNLELARAWWAFFMASQSQMFSGFGLGTGESRRIIGIAQTLLPDAGLEKAFEFVRVVADDSGDPLGERIILDLLPRPAGGGEVVELTPGRIDEFLAARITREIWDRLHLETRQDVRDAESMWERSSREMGAGRVDWGGLGVVYTRAIERELKAHILPVLELLRDAGIVGKGRKSETIGSIVAACENARSALDSEAPAELKTSHETVSRLAEAFRGDLRVITQIRNRAAHGDRSEPVVRMEFVELRAAIFERGVFRTIVECGQPVW